MKKNLLIYSMCLSIPIGETLAGQPIEIGYTEIDLYPGVEENSFSGSPKFSAEVRHIKSSEDYFAFEIDLQMFGKEPFVYFASSSDQELSDIGYGGIVFKDKNGSMFDYPISPKAPSYLPVILLGFNELGWNRVDRTQISASKKSLASNIKNNEPTFDLESIVEAVPYILLFPLKEYLDCEPGGDFAASANRITCSNTQYLNLSEKFFP